MALLGSLFSRDPVTPAAERAVYAPNEVPYRAADFMFPPQSNWGMSAQASPGLGYAQQLASQAQDPGTLSAASGIKPKMDKAQKIKKVKK